MWVIPGRKASLGMESLGKPAHAIIIRDRRPRREPQKVVRREGLGLLWRDTYEVLIEANKGRVPLTSEEVLENLEKFRTQNAPGNKLSEEEWAKLRDSLYNGFTQNQLLGYVKYLQTSPDTALDLKRAQKVDPLSWRPRTSVFLSLNKRERNDPSKINPGFKNMRGKMIVLEVIMRDYWKLGVRDEIGQIDMQFSPTVFSTLQRLKNEPFKTYQVPGITIEVRKPQHSIRIIGSEDRCLEVREAFEEAVSKIQVKEIDLPEKGPIFGADDKRVQDEFLEWLQEQYNVLCEKDEKAGKLTVNHTNEIGSDIENAVRSVELSGVLPLDPSSGVFTYRPETETANLYPTIDTSNLPWPERQKNWIRWAKPVPNTAISGGRFVLRPPDAAFSREPSAPLARISASLFEKKEESFPESLEHSNMREVLTASVGTCLFEQNTAGHTADEVPFTQFSDYSSCSFVRDVPYSLRFLRKLCPITSNDSQDICRIRLLPSPRNTESVPPIELEMVLSPQNQYLRANVTPTIARATAIVAERNADLLLPDTTLDVRFTKTVHYDLFDGKAPLEMDPLETSNPVISRLRKSVANFSARYPLSGPQPRLPAFCTLLIPRRLVKSEWVPTGSSIIHGEAIGFIEAHYILPPMQFLTSSTITKFKYRDLELSYNSRSTGPLLAQRTTDVTLSVGRYDKELRPRTALPGRRLSSVASDENAGSLQFVFPQLYSRACRLAFELGTPHISRDPNIVDDID
ncbi:hypothetical protein VTO42DRAFT_54 [Malbranchea cinnamomea]